MKNQQDLVIYCSALVVAIGLSGIVGHMTDTAGLLTWGGEVAIAIPTCVAICAIGFCLMVLSTALRHEH